MKLRSSVCLLALACILGFLSISSVMAGIDPAGTAKEPPIAYVQGMIWKRLELADFVLTGSIYTDTDKSKKRYPVILRTRGHMLVYEFQDQPLQIRVQLDPGKFTVEKRKSSKDHWVTVPDKEMGKSILDTNITYEDLGIDFVNWDDVTPLGTDTIKTLAAYVFEAKPGPGDHSRFAKVRYWVSSQYWAFLRIDGLNAQGQTIKRVEVQDVMQLGQYYVFKQMKVGNMIPDRNDMASSTTFIDIDHGTEGSGLPASSSPATSNTALPVINTDKIPVAPIAAPDTSAAPAAPADTSSTPTTPATTPAPL